MNASIARERALPDDSRITNVEINLQHLQSDVTEIKGTVACLREAFEAFKIEVAREFGAIRTEMAKEIGTLRSEIAKEIGTLRSDMAQEFGSVRAHVAQEIGSLRTSIERAKLWMVVTGLGTILSVWGAAFALARFLKP